MIFVKPASSRKAAAAPHAVGGPSRTLAWRGADASSPRAVRHVSAGQATGYGARLVTPGYLGRLLHPVVALDVLDDASRDSPACAGSASLVVLCGEGSDGRPGSGVRLHLADGIATPAEPYAPDRRGDAPAVPVLGGTDAALSCLHLRLGDGESWYFAPPSDHGRVWLAVACGGLLIGDREIGREVALFAAGGGPVQVQAIGPVEALVFTAPGTAPW